MKQAVFRIGRLARVAAAPLLARLVRAAAAALFAAPLLAAPLLAGCSDPPVSEPTICHSPGNTGAAPDEPPPRPASAAELALLAPLGPGSKLEGFDLREVRAQHGVIEVVCEKAEARVILSIALLAEGGPSPPASTDRYAVFYSVRGATQQEAERLATALAAALKASSAPPPPGLGPFVPRPVSL